MFTLLCLGPARLEAQPAIAPSRPLSLEHPHAPGELLVFLTKPAPLGEHGTATFVKERAKLLEEFDASIVRVYPEIDAALIRFRTPIDGTELEERSQKLASNPSYFRSPELNQIVIPAQPALPGVLPNDYDPQQQWGLERIHIDKAWERGEGSEKVRVAIVDSGIALAHEDLAKSMWTNLCEVPADGIDNNCDGQSGNGYPDDVNGWNFLDRNGDPNDDHRHGTQVAGVIGAVTNNSIGIAGISWEISLVALKFYSKEVPGETADAIDAIIYAASLPVDVINLSWKVPGYNEKLLAALEYAQLKDVLIVAAAGHGDESGIDLDTDRNYPCSFKLDHKLDSLICVTATNADDELGPLASWGSRTVDLGAPGENILSTVPGNYTKYGNGFSSSMAAPHVAGIAALISAKCPSWTALQIRDSILKTVAVVPALEETISKGLLDATEAVPCNCDATPCTPQQQQTTQ